MFSTPETSLHVLDKNREISPLEREEGYGGNDLPEWKTLWDTPTTDLGAESEPGDGGKATNCQSPCQKIVCTNYRRNIFRVWTELQKLLPFYLLQFYEIELIFIMVDGVVKKISETLSLIALAFFNHVPGKASPTMYP